MTGTTINGGTITVTAGNPGGAGRPGTVTSSTPVCTSVPLAGTAPAGLLSGDPSIVDPRPGLWYLVTCPSGRSLVYVRAGQPAPTGPSPAVLAQQALASMRLGTPAIHTAPPLSAATAVNVDTWFYMDSAAWRPLSATATAGPVSATARAVPSKVVWTTTRISPPPSAADEGSSSGSLTCAGPGVPYDTVLAAQGRGPCVYYYRSPGTYRLTATVYYSVTWTAQGAPGGGDLGLVAAPSSSTPIRVDELVSVNTVPG